MGCDTCAALLVQGSECADCGRKFGPPTGTASAAPTCGCAVIDQSPRSEGDERFMPAEACTSCRHPAHRKPCDYFVEPISAPREGEAPRLDRLQLIRDLDSAIHMVDDELIHGPDEPPHPRAKEFLAYRGRLLSHVDALCATAPTRDVVAEVRDTPCPDGHGGRNGCISQGLAADIENAGYFCAARLRASQERGK